MVAAHDGYNNNMGKERNACILHYYYFTAKAEQSIAQQKRGIRCSTSLVSHANAPGRMEAGDYDRYDHHELVHRYGRLEPGSSSLKTGLGRPSSW